MRVSPLPSLAIGVDRSQPGEVLAEVKAARRVRRRVTTSGRIGVFTVECLQHDRSSDVRGYTVAVATARDLRACPDCRAETLL